MPDANRRLAFDVFLSHSAKDKDVVREVANRLRNDGLSVWFDEWVLKPGDNILAKIEEGLESSRVLVLCMSANAFGADWAQLETGTFLFRDPLNKERRFIPLRLDNAPIKSSLAQFLYVNWISPEREQEYAKLLESCRPPQTQPEPEPETARARFEQRIMSLGHVDAIRSVVFSPDGQHALTGSDDQTVRLWDLDSGHCLKVFEGHIGGVLSAAWSPDSSRALSSGEDQTVRLWDLDSGHCLKVFEGHTGSVYSVAWSPNSSRALSGADDRTVRLWDLDSGRCLKVLIGHTGSVWSVAWSPDSSRALSASSDQTVRLWDLDSGRCLKVFKGHTDSVYSVAWSPDSSHALSGADDQTVRLWDLDSRRCLKVFKGYTGSVWSVAWSPDSSRALFGTDDQTVRLWDLDSGRCLKVFEGHTGSVYSVAWSPNSSRALSGADDQTVRLWDLDSGHCLKVFEGHTGTVYNVAWSPDSSRALSGADDETVRLWDLHSGRCLKVFEGHTGTVYSVVWSSDSSRALSGADDQTVRLWDLDSGHCLKVLKGHTGEVNSVAWSLDSSHALSGADDETVRLWDLDSGHCLKVLEGHTGRIWCIAWSPDSSRALSSGEDHTVRLWDLDSGRCLKVFNGHTDSVYSVAWSPDSSRALSGADDETVRLWDLDSGRCLKVFNGHTSSVWSVAWSRDGQRAFSTATNGVLREWDVAEFVVPAARDQPVLTPALDQVQYTNAKVLLVGDSGVGKTGLSNYLAHGLRVEDDKPLPSTDGAWATHWPLHHASEKAGVDREIWLWDFAGQVDYRLVHQLFMNDTAAAVLVFNPQSENPFEAIGHWDRDLQKAARGPFAKLLVAGRVDRGGLMVSRASVEKFIAERGFRQPLLLTSAKTAEGCDQLREAIVKAIDWQNIPETTSPALYQRLKQEILNLRDSGLVLIRLAELKQRMEMTLAEDFQLAELESVVGLLAGPGMVQRLDFGGFILLRPEVLSRYAAAVVRKVRKHPQELGCIREDDFLAGDLDYQDFKRLPREDEIVVLRTLLETFISRAWCLRQPYSNTALLTFPSYFRRERKKQPSHPHVLVNYRFDGPADDIYATLVVRLHHTLAFESTALWQSAADFKTQTDAALGFTLERETEGTSRLEVYFEPDVDENSRVVFLRYVHEHLAQHAENVVRLRNYFCQNKKCKRFNQPFSDREMIDEALAADGEGKVFCPGCGKSILLRDLIEEKFESPAVKEQVRKQDAEAQFVIDNESRELILVGHAYSIVAEAGHIYRGYTNSDHGIDGEIEFKDNQGRATGKRLYLQLKSGDSYLTKRQRDDAEVFQIKNPRWADYWQKQSYPVMLVIRTSDRQIRWMDVSDYLKRASAGGREITQIVFEGEPLDMMSVRRWGDKLLR